MFARRILAAAEAAFVEQDTTWQCMDVYGIDGDDYDDPDVQPNDTDQRHLDELQTARAATTLDEMAAQQQKRLQDLSTVKPIHSTRSTNDLDPDQEMDGDMAIDQVFQRHLQRSHRHRRTILTTSTPQNQRMCYRLAHSQRALQAHRFR